ncbi:protein of unknown function [Nitrospira japonica]|uniref:Uncharacterized protein n=1 Tax=Nitrospira japonica TaxID=1325564 RepID=A0A1W1I8P6_9BACT|nr:protein of unknown function [Nitrospira japonica]
MSVYPASRAAAVRQSNLGLGLRIDTPEICGKCDRKKSSTRKAQAVTSQLLNQAKQIESFEIRRDKYFRFLAGLRLTGRALLDAGLAVPHTGAPRRPSGVLNPSRHRLEEY